MNVVLKCAYLASVAVGTAASAWLYRTGNVRLFTWHDRQLQGMVGLAVQLLMVASTCVVLWVPSIGNHAPAADAVRVFVASQAAYQLAWAAYVALQDCRFIGLRLTVPVVAWSLSQAAALAALFFVGSAVPFSGWYFAVLIAQLLVTTYTVVLDGYLYLRAMLRREDHPVRVAYAQWARNVLYSLCLGQLLAYVLTRHKDAAPTQCSSNWTCPFMHSAGINARIADRVAARNSSINYNAVAVASHIINFGQPALAVVGFFFAKQYMRVNMLINCVLFAAAAAHIAKNTTFRQRPAVHYNITNVTELQHRSANDALESFFSGDAAVSAAGATYIVLYLLEHNHKAAALLATLLALTGCMLRVIAMMHWTTDVATGIAVGSFAGIVFGSDIVSL